MELKQFVLLATFFIIQSQCYASAVTQNVLVSALQDILSPVYTDKVMQLINVAATDASNNAMPNIIGARDCGCPPRILSNDIPTRILTNNDIPVRILTSNDIPARILASNDIPARILTRNDIQPRILTRNDVPSAANGARIISDPRISYQTYPQAVIDPMQQVNIIDSLTFPKEIYQLPVTPECSYAYPKASYVTSTGLPASPSYVPPNPYLPIASPMSGIPSALPPPTASRGQFLRKIPIPPPTL